MGCVGDREYGVGEMLSEGKTDKVCRNTPAG